MSEFRSSLLLETPEANATLAASLARSSASSARATSCFNGASRARKDAQ
jgi:hypothetical protein